jgi:branched-chain amino acid transport system permease protein
MIRRFTNPLTLALVGVVLAGAPFVVADRYLLHVVSLVAAYWILVAGLNLVVGFAGQLSIGHIGLLAIGGYAFAILAGGYDWPPLLALAASGVIGALCGWALGLPSLRLPSFYFAMATLAFATVVTELIVARADITSGGAGLAVPGFNAPFASPSGFYWLAAGLAILVTIGVWNVANSNFGAALVAIRDSDIAAASVGVPIFRMKLIVFTFSGFTAGLAGAIFASLQTFITPETFQLDDGILFFICIIVGGRNSILGPFIGTVILMTLPDLVSPLAAYGGLVYGAILLAVVLVAPKGIGELIARMFGSRRWRSEDRNLTPDYERVGRAIQAEA